MLWVGGQLRAVARVRDVAFNETVTLGAFASVAGLICASLYLAASRPGRYELPFGREALEALRPHMPMVRRGAGVAGPMRARARALAPSMQPAPCTLRLLHR